MATFPHNLCGIRQDGHAEQHTPVVLRSEVERGMPRQRRTSADALVSVPCTLVFRSAAAAAEFEAWYYAEGFGWFDFTLPRTGAVVQARIVGGDIGGLTPITPAWNASERSITLEYIRPGFIQLPPGLHSVNPARILSVQRNSTATYVDDAGVLQTAAAHVARYQGGQVLVEGEATNHALRSNTFSAAAWGKSGTISVAENAVTAPDGTLTADTVTFTSGTTNDRLDQSLPMPAVDGQRWSYSVWLRGSGAVNIEINTTTGVGGRDALLVNLTPTWARYSVSVTFSNPTGNVRVHGLIIRTPGVRVVDVWGAQVERGSPSSYIPTTTTPATRAADLITVAA